MVPIFAGDTGSDGLFCQFHRIIIVGSCDTIILAANRFKWAQGKMAECSWLEYDYSLE